MFGEESTDTSDAMDETGDEIAALGTAFVVVGR